MKSAGFVTLETTLGRSLISISIQKLQEARAGDTGLKMTILGAFVFDPNLNGSLRCFEPQPKLQKALIGMHFSIGALNWGVRIAISLRPLLTLHQLND